MKKFLKLFVLLILVIPFSVYADMGAPEIKPYEVIVTNPNGIDYYDNINDLNVKGHLNYNDKVTIEYESRNSVQISIGESYYYLKSVDGLVAVKDNVTPEELGTEVNKLDSKKKALVYKTGGVDILAGPGLGYKKVGHLDKGTVVEYGYDTGYSTVFIYVETSEGNGWLSALESSVLLEDESMYIFSEDYKDTCGTIPKNTIIKSNYKTDQWSQSTLFKYEGCEMLIKTFREKNPVKIVPLNGKVNTELKVYSEASTSSNVVGTIPANSSVVSYGMADDFDYYTGEVTTYTYYVKYNDIKGWIFATADEAEFSYQDPAENDLEVTYTPKEDATTNEVTVTEDTNKSNKMSANTIVIICVIAGLSLAVIALGIIVLTNKKKNN